MEWYGGDEPGSYHVYDEVFNPFMIEALRTGDKQKTKRVFEHVEKIIVSDNEYASDCVVIEVLEKLTDFDDIRVLGKQCLLPKSLEAFEALEPFFNR